MDGYLPRRYVLKGCAGSERTSGDDAEMRMTEAERRSLVGLRVQGTQGQLRGSFGGVDFFPGREVRR
jgi:hypothetical protein